IKRVEVADPPSAEGQDHPAHRAAAQRFGPSRSWPPQEVVQGEPKPGRGTGTQDCTARDAWVHEVKAHESPTWNGARSRRHRPFRLRHRRFPMISKASRRREFSGLAYRALESHLAKV